MARCIRLVILTVALGMTLGTGPARAQQPAGPGGAALQPTVAMCAYFQFMAITGGSAPALMLANSCQTVIQTLTTAGSLLPPAPQPLTMGPCQWTLTASSPVGMVSQGDQATFMPIGPATMILLAASKPNFGGGGQIIVSGVRGPGSYPVGAAQGPGDAQGATLTIENQAGELLGLSTADGGTSSFGGRPVQYPPAATLTITHFGAQEIRGDLTGVFFVSGYAAQGPSQFTHVPVNLVFSAGATMGPNACP